MKIKDIVAEGVLDFAKGLWNTGSIAGAKAASQQAAGEKDLQVLAKGVINKWNQYYGQTKDPDIATWATNFFKNDVSKIPAPVVTDANAVNNYLTTITRARQAGSLQSTAGTGKKYKPRQTAITPIQPTAPQTPAAAPTGTIGATGKRGATQTPTTPSTQSQAYQSPFGITIKASSDRGHVLTYKNKNYWLNDRGMWADDGKNTPAAEASAQLQAEMTKVMDADIAMNPT